MIQGDAKALPLPARCVDAVVCDPPYGTETDSGYGRSELWDGGLTIANDDDLSELDAALPEMRRVLSPAAWLIIFISPRKQLEARTLVTSHGVELFGEAVWDKREAGLGHPIRYAHETVLICRIGDPPYAAHALLSSWASRAPFRINRGHPHEKPVAFMRELVRWACPAGGLVLDPFCGSGSTGVACVQEGRRFIGAELDPHWCAVARRRVTQAVPSLFHQPHIQEEIA